MKTQLMKVYSLAKSPFDRIRFYNGNGKEAVAVNPAVSPAVSPATKLEPPGVAGLSYTSPSSPPPPPPPLPPPPSAFSRNHPQPTPTPPRTEIQATATATAAAITTTEQIIQSFPSFTPDLPAPPPAVLSDNVCLVPGEAVVRIEDAPQNSRRIFAGIDILIDTVNAAASGVVNGNGNGNGNHAVDTVWDLLTDYGNLQNVIPNLKLNEVLTMYNAEATYSSTFSSTHPPSSSTPPSPTSLRGARLKQIGGAKVMGINFSARTTLDVREWVTGLPPSFHEPQMHPDSSPDVNTGALIPLVRDVFPRPFSLSQIGGARDITMQSVEGDKGEFRIYQGVWRMQPLPECAPPGMSAMRLTYAVELSPRQYLPVGLIERRIAEDLKANLLAIREFVSKA